MEFGGETLMCGLGTILHQFPLILMGPWKKKVINPTRGILIFIASLSEEISGETLAEEVVQEYNSGTCTNF